jgi:hypothetical protein
MLKFLCVVVLLFPLASCTQSTVDIPNTANPIQNVENPGTTLNIERSQDAPEWIETNIKSVVLGVWLPPGWHYDDTGGLTLIERMSSIDTDVPAETITFYFFVPDLDRLLDQNQAHDNLAYAALNEASHNPEHIGAAEVTQPVQATWGDINAAYYTYTAPDGIRGWVLAFAVPSDDQIVVANVTAPQNEVSRLRDILPPLLSDLRINRERLGDHLPADLPDILIGEEREAG